MRLAQLRLHRVQSYNTRLAQLRLCRVVGIVRGSLNYACVARDRMLDARSTPIVLCRSYSMRLAQLRLCSLGSYGHTGLEPRSHSGGQKGKSMATLQYLLVICTSCIQHSFAGPNSVGLCPHFCLQFDLVFRLHPNTVVRLHPNSI